MDYDIELKFQKLLKSLENNFGPGLDLTALLFIIGVNEVGFGHKKYTKQEKVDLLHVAICTLLAPMGYYQFKERDENNWPHYDLVNLIPTLSDREQQHLLKEAVIDYCIEQDYVKADALA